MIREVNEGLGFHLDFKQRKKVSRAPIIPENGKEPYKLRDWQSETLAKYKKSKLLCVNVLTGGGKSIFAQALILDKKNGPKKKFVISVPQLMIGASFQNQENARFIEGKRWVVDYDLCRQNGNTVEKLVNFLSGKQGGVLLCSHQTLIAAWNQVNGYVSDNCHFTIDEAHHAQTLENYENKLGKCIGGAIENGAGILLLTATCFRSDALPVIPPQYQDRFDRFNLPLDVYLDKYVSSFKSFDFRCILIDDPEKGGYIEAIGNIVRSKFKKSIIYIPYVNSDWAICKKETVHKICEQIVGRKLKKTELKESKEGLIEIDGVRIVDLVDKDDRDSKRAFIGDGKKDNFDYIITLGVFKEGANWVHAERAIICSPRQSIVEVCQITGRVLREIPIGNTFKDKYPEVVQIFGKPVGRTDEVMKSWMNDFMLYFGASLILEQLFKPVEVLNSRGEVIRGKGGRPRDFLSEVTKDNSEEMNRIISELGKVIINTHVEGESKTKAKQDYDKQARKWLKGEGYRKNLDFVTQQVFNIHERRSKKLTKISGQLDIIDEYNHPVAWLRNAMSNFGVNKFEDIRRVMEYGEKSATIEDYKKRIRQEGYKTPSEWHRNKHPSKFVRNIYSHPNISDFWPKTQVIPRATINENEKISILQLFQNGLSIKKLAQQYKVSPKKISVIINNLGGNSNKRTEILKGKFNKWLVLEKSDKKSRDTQYKCQCDCGKISLVNGFALKSGQSKSCGCLKLDKQKKTILISPEGKQIIFAGRGVTGRFIKTSNMSSLIQKICYHIKGYCLYNPKLVVTTHQERVDKGLYKKYIKLNTK
jgi:hypothetical protein